MNFSQRLPTRSRLTNQCSHVGQKRAVFVLLASTLIGVLAVVFALKFLINPVKTVATEPKVFGHVMTAGQDMKAGTLLTESQLTRTPWYSAPLPVGSSPDVADRVGRVTAIDVRKGEVLLDSLLTQPAENRSLSESVRHGLRAMSIAVSDVSDVSGFIVPGNQVDVLLRVSDADNGGFSRLIIERLPVLAVGQDRDIKDPATARLVKTVTLEVTPSQAERLDLARTLGTISLVLRNPSDAGKSGTQGVIDSDVRPVVPVLEIIRGTERNLQSGN